MNESDEAREAEARMQGLISAAYTAVWLIRNDEGPVLLEDEEGHRAMPLWPTEASALNMLRGGWSQFQVESIEHQHLMGWLLNLSEDGVDIATYPDRDLNGYIISASELHEMLRGESFDA